MTDDGDKAGGPGAEIRGRAVKGGRHMISSGHYLATEAGFDILEAGGNAVDAGVAAGLALGVVQSDLVNVAGVAPIILHLAERGETLCISGLGTWPRAATLALFVDRHDGAIPAGILRTVVPAAPDAWITALARYGTMSFAEVAAAAIRLARGGFAMHALMAENIAGHAEGYARWPANAAIYLPGGRPPAVGERFLQADLARSLQYMADEEAAVARRGRAAGLGAARAAFYTGDIAATIVAYHRARGGLLTMADMAGFRVGIEAPVTTRFSGTAILGCGPWCQGPVLLQMLSLLDGTDLAALGHNEPAYIHTVTEAMKLAFADREYHYADPRFADVPISGLLSAPYAAARRTMIRPDRAWPGLPPAGDPRAPAARLAEISPTAGPGRPEDALDTSYVAVVDRAGNAFSATPSDTSWNAPVVPGTGLVPSGRGSQSWARAGHPAAVGPGKRPRLTPNPAIAIREHELIMPFGTPGGDVQCQAMLQMLLNHLVFGMDLQAAVAAPRFASYSFPGSFEPHDYYPGRLNLEGRIAPATADRLAALGHVIEWWPAHTWRAGGVCAVAYDPRTGALAGAADPRRPCRAIGR